MCKKCGGTGNLNEYLPYGIIVNACPDCKPSEEELRAKDLIIYRQMDEAYERLGVEKPDSFIKKLKELEEFANDRVRHCS